MDGNRRMGTALIVIATLALMTAAQWRPSPAASWQFRLEVASVRLSFTSAETPVRNRTGLFEIGQSLVKGMAS